MDPDTRGRILGRILERSGRILGRILGKNRNRATRRLPSLNTEGDPDVAAANVLPVQRQHRKGDSSADCKGWNRGCEQAACRGLLLGLRVCFRKLH